MANGGFPRLSGETIDNLKLRRLLWKHHGHQGIYGDDGQMQCGGVDFKHASLDVLEHHIDVKGD